MKELPLLEEFDTVDELVQGCINSGWDQEDLKRLVTVGILTQTEYDDICKKFDGDSLLS